MLCAYPDEDPASRFGYNGFGMSPNVKHVDSFFLIQH